MFKNFIVYRIDPACELPPLTALEDALQPGRFVPCTPTQMESLGWVEPRGDKHASLVEAVGGQLILKFKTESKGVPASAVNERLEERAAQIEQETGRKPRGKRKKELKEEIIQDLLPRAFSKSAVTTVWIDPEARLLLIGAGSLRRCDRITSALVDTLAQAGSMLRLNPVQTQLSPATAMAEWLTSQEPPAGFSVDRECELKQPDSEKATVRYVRHTLDIDEIAEHIRQGKVPTRLAMTWSSRVSFMLCEDMSIRKLQLLDVVLEQKPRGSQDAGEGFDGDVAITTGELCLLLPDLIDALGGEQVPGEAAAPAAAPEPAAQLKAA